MLSFYGNAHPTLPTKPKDKLDSPNESSYNKKAAKTTKQKNIRRVSSDPIRFTIDLPPKNWTIVK
jgi:hypothetical protein